MILPEAAEADAARTRRVLGSRRRIRGRTNRLLLQLVQQRLDRIERLLLLILLLN